ncbi:MAG: glycosyltransferase [Dehalococcoidia bacterium]
MKTILNVVHYPVFGGPHNRVLRLTEPLLDRGWRTIIVLPCERGDAAARLRDGGVEVVQLPLGRLRASLEPRTQLGYAAGYVPDVLRLCRLIRRSGADLVVIGGLVNAQAAIAASLAGVPVVWQIVDSRTPPLVARLLMPSVQRLASSVMFNGDALARLHTGGKPLKVPSFVYYPPVDTSRLLPSAELRRSTRLTLGVPPEAALVGMVANINPAKGIEYFVRAASLIYRARPNAWFAVVGPFYETHRAYTAQLMAEVVGSGIPAERIIFTGGRDEVANLYPAFDLHLITSRPRSEGSTTTAMEAMACGVPVVAVDVGAVQEAVEDGVTGLIVRPLDTAGIAEAALCLLDDPARRAEMGSLGRLRAVERFDVAHSAVTHIAAFEAALSRWHSPDHSRETVATPRLPDAGELPDVERLLVCPLCHGELSRESDALTCAACCHKYEVIDGIPLLLADPRLAAHDEIAHDDHKHRQAAYFDRAEGEEFEIERPRGSSRLYAFMLGEKLRRSVTGIEALLPGATAVTVCGGSGMEAEFLARMGAAVLTVDLSLGAARRSRERARRRGLAIRSVVADAERLPLRDGSIDVACVHDGLHHLEFPERGVVEMARVAGRAVSVSEPARAAATALAVRFGLALEREEAGNRVARFRTRTLIETLRKHGFCPVHAERYAMYYRHRPGPLSRRLSRTPFFNATLLAWRIGNRLAGRHGNKLTVVAVRATGLTDGAAK